jgi:hypothetical protein
VDLIATIAFGFIQRDFELECTSTPEYAGTRRANLTSGTWRAGGAGPLRGYLRNRETTGKPVKAIRSLSEARREIRKNDKERASSNKNVKILRNRLVI